MSMFCRILHLARGALSDYNSGMLTKTKKRARKPSAEMVKWIRDVDHLVHEIASWAEDHEWWVHREYKTIRDDEPFAAYRVPVLMIQAAQGRILVEPVAHHIADGDGRVDIISWPTLDRVRLILTRGRWEPRTERSNRLSKPFSRDMFFRIAKRLMAA